MSGLIVHEWVEQHGGAERVLDGLVAAFPDAEILCLWNDSPRRFQDSNIRETWLARSRLRGRKAALLPIMPFFWRSVDIAPYEWVVVSSHMFAHHVGASAQRARVPVFAYVHTPARYVWDADIDQRGQGLHARIAARALKRLDIARAQETAEYAANSDYVAGRILRYWGQESRVIHPPVDVEVIKAGTPWEEKLNPDDRRTIDALPESFVLGASRLVPYKRIDHVIEFADKLNSAVVIAGGGPERQTLEDRARKAGVDATFLGRVSDELLYALYERAKLYVFPAIEDFGIMPIEAIALGTPVVVNELGGAAETVRATGGGVCTDFGSDMNAANLARMTVGLNMKMASDATEIYSRRRFVDEVRLWIKHPDRRESNPSSPPSSGHDPSYRSSAPQGRGPV
nr:glycosyltransferase [Gordonia sp. (in: high G+C Gram-positive bacteria)]